MKLKLFQREDLARSALHDGLIFGWDTGLGKTLSMYVWPLLKVGLHRGPRRFGWPVQGEADRPICPAEPVLFIASGDLHEQIIAEGIKHFGTSPKLLDSQETFMRLSSVSPNGRRTLPPGYYLTTYTQLSRNGVTPFPELDRSNPHRMLGILNLSQKDVEEFFQERGQRYAKHYDRLCVTPESCLAELKSKWFKARKDANQYVQDELDESFYLLQDFAPMRNGLKSVGLHDLKPEQRNSVTGRFVEMAHKSMQQNLGMSIYKSNLDREIKCVYSPTLADLCCDTFACVVADEGVKLKGEDTLVGKGVRQMNPKYRLILTATPIKNRLPDVFRLAWWAVGAHHSANPRFPFGNDDAETFAEEFLVTERNLSAEQRSESGKRFVKKTPQVCNIHRLWKLFAPIILRRRKTDCGEELVKMNRHVVRVPMGKAQAEVYKYHLDAKYLDKNMRPALGAQLQALRVAAANPTSQLLERPAGDMTKGTPRSNLSYIPKLASSLSLIQPILDRKEQVIVFSAFHDSLDALSARLSESGVKHVVLDGRTSPAKRGVAAAQFKKGVAGGVPVMLAGVECMSEGHSFHLCSNVIRLAYSWAFDKFLQAINRIWRLNSVRDVNVYAVIADGSIDRKLEANIQEKGDAAELVLDGHLLGEDPSEVNLAELLQIAAKEFKQGAGHTLDERELVKDWPALRAQLAAAAQAWAIVHRPSAITPPNLLPIPLENPKPKIQNLPASAFDDLPLWRQAFRRYA